MSTCGAMHSWWCMPEKKKKKKTYPINGTGGGRQSAAWPVAVPSHQEDRQMRGWSALSAVIQCIQRIITGDFPNRQITLY